ncbi:MAG: biopolymer transporter ExbD [Kangiellaceae bacterium]
MRKNMRTIAQDSEVDMTPMLDIVFIMLIFFIVTTSFVKESGLNIQRPTLDKSPPTKDQRNIVIKINELEDIQFGQRLIQQDAVLANVQAAISKNPKVGIMVQVAEVADTRVLVSVVDQIKQAGLANVTVSRLPDS